MTKLKVVTVNINTSDVKQAINEVELPMINKYLEEGYFIVEKFSTVSNATNMPYINLTFILENDLK